MKPALARDWELERFALAELDGERTAELERQLLADPALRTRLAELEASDAAILAAYPPAVVAARIRGRRQGEVAAPARRPRRGRSLLLLAPALAAATVLVAVSQRGPATDDDAQDAIGVGASTERTKGLAPALLVYRRRGAESEVLASGAWVHPGDVLQLKYVAAGRRYGVILSIDGAGGVTLHFPEAPVSPTSLAGEGTVPSAYELDEAPGFERFVFVTAAVPIAADEVLLRARAVARSADAAAAPLDLGRDYEEHSTLLRKTP